MSDEENISKEVSGTTETPETEVETETEAQDTSEGMQDVSERQELLQLKKRADLLGISYGPNIGLDTLRERIRAKLEDEQTISDPTNTEEAQDDFEAMEHMNITEVKTDPQRPLTASEKRNLIVKEQMKLIRIRISCMNPQKANLPGEIFTVGNEAIGTVRKFVPYGEETNNGYHVPNILYQFLRNKRFLNIRTRTDPNTKRLRIEQGMAPEFSIEVLPPLTQKELDDLAKAQLAAGSVTDEESL